MLKLGEVALLRGDLDRAFEYLDGAAHTSLFAPYWSSLAERNFGDAMETERVGEEIDALLRDL